MTARNLAIASLLAGAVLGFTSLPALAGSHDPAALEFFEARVRPVLVEHCYKCHSADAKALKGGLRLDGGTSLLKGGESGPAIVPGDPAASRLITAIRYDDPDLQMPPKTKLAPEQIADLTEWVKQGA